MNFIGLLVSLRRLTQEKDIWHRYYPKIIVIIIIVLLVLISINVIYGNFVKFTEIYNWGASIVYAGNTALTERSCNFVQKFESGEFNLINKELDGITKM